MRIKCSCLGFLICIVLVSGVAVAQLPSIDIQKSTNGEDADTPPGPSIPVGDPVCWDYVVTNTGDVTLLNIMVTDSDPDIGQVGTIESLDPGESVTLTVCRKAIEGQNANIGTASGNDAAGNQVQDQDPSHYFGGDPGPGPSVPVLPAVAIPIALLAIGLLAINRKSH